MADPAFRNSSLQDLNNPASITVAKPTNTASTDVVVLTIIDGAGAANTAATWTAPAGWTQFTNSPFNYPAGHSTMNLQLWWALGTVDFTQTFSKSGGAGTQFVGVVCESWQNVDNTNPIDVQATSLSSSTNSSTVTAASVTTVHDRSVELIATGDTLDRSLTATSFTQDENAHVQQSAAILRANSVTTPAGATGTVSVSSGNGTNEDIVALPFALSPVVAGVTFPTKVPLTVPDGLVYPGWLTTAYLRRVLARGVPRRRGRLTPRFGRPLGDVPDARKRRRRKVFLPLGVG